MELLTNKREILGKKVRFLRRQGITPVHLFGHNVESKALQCDTIELRHALARAGMTGLISLKVDRASKPRNVMVREVQREPRTGELVHVDFYQVSMKKKIRVDVPIIPVGDSPVLKSKEHFLAQELNTLTVECLPDEIPNSIELDLSLLTEAEQAIHVRDITLVEGIVVLNDLEHLVVKISTQRTERLMEEEAEEAEEAEEVIEAPLPEKESTGESSSAS